MRGHVDAPACSLCSVRKYFKDGSIIRKIFEALSHPSFQLNLSSQYTGLRMYVKLALRVRYSLLAPLQTKKCDAQDPRLKGVHYLLYFTQPLQRSEVCGGSSAQGDPCLEVVPTPTHIYDGQGGLCRYTVTP